MSKTEIKIGEYPTPRRDVPPEANYLWNTILPDLWEKGLIRPENLPLFEAYCTAHACEINLAKELKRRNRVKDFSAETIRLVKEHGNVAKLMNTLANSLLLSPASHHRRGRITPHNSGKGKQERIMQEQDLMSQLHGDSLIK